MGAVVRDSSKGPFSHSAASVNSDDYSTLSFWLAGLLSASKQILINFLNPFLEKTDAAANV